jgi:nucleoside-diphosphate-sugar epimerase
MPTTVLVTGGAGFIGSRLVRALLRRHYVVRVIDNFLFAQDSLRGLGPSVTVLEGDIRDADVISYAVRGADAVVHLAAIANDPQVETPSELMMEVNVYAVERLVAVAKRAGAQRFVNASSASVYGLCGPEPAREGDSKQPRTPYARCKVESESFVASANSAGFSTVSLRLATLCGLSERPRLDLTVNAATFEAMTTGALTVKGAGSSRPQLHLGDCVRALTMLLEAPEATVGGQAYNLARVNLTGQQLAQVVCSTLGGSIDLTLSETSSNESFAISSARIREALGFRPRLPIPTAVRAVADSLRMGRIPDPENPRYRNALWMRASREALEA